MSLVGKRAVAIRAELVGEIVREFNGIKLVTLKYDHPTRYSTGEKKEQGLYFTDELMIESSLERKMRSVLDDTEREKS